MTKYKKLASTGRLVEVCVEDCQLEELQAPLSLGSP